MCLLIVCRKNASSIEESKRRNSFSIEQVLSNGKMKLRSAVIVSLFVISRNILPLGF